MTQCQSSPENQVIYNHYAQLIGGRITKVELITDFSSDEVCVLLTVKKGKKEYMVDVLSDEEGNGTGFLEIIEMNKNEEI